MVVNYRRNTDEDYGSYCEITKKYRFQLNLYVQAKPKQNVNLVICHAFLPSQAA